MKSQTTQAPQVEAKEVAQEAARRSLIWLVVVLPLAVVVWQASQGLALGALTLGLTVGAALLLVLCESALAFDGRWGTTVGGTLTDFTYAFVGFLTEKATLLVCLGLAASAGMALSGALGVDLWPRSWGLGFQVLLALVIADVGTYARHRLFHWSPTLWRFHQIHHSPTGLYWIRSAHTHPLEQLCIMLAIMFPIAFLGASETVLVIVAFVYGLSGLLQHANVDARSSFLNRIFATTEVHRIHHEADERSNHSNFSAFFVFMDLLFGTYRRPESHPPPHRVGLEGETAFPADFWTHLLLPFRRDPQVAEAGEAGGARAGARAEDAAPPRNHEEARP